MSAPESEPRDGTMEAGLYVLAQVARPNQVFTHREIAKACGCSWQNIWLIEKRALRKVRERLRRTMKASYGDFAAGRFYREEVA
jgi:hypothetical protein